MTKEESWLLREKYGGLTSDAFLTDCARLKQGEPLAFVIGHTPFLETTIWLDSHPLIPRTETEFWLNHCHQEMSRFPGGNFHALDLCAGSGAIGVATRQRFPSAMVDFAELDPTHAATIRKNLEVNSLSVTQSQIFIGDLFSPLPHGARYNYILANPPYIDKDLGRTDESVIAHEPHLALFSENHGLSHIERIINESRDYLLPQGELWLEHEPEQAHKIRNIGQASAFTVYTHTDQFGIERYSRLMLE